MTKNTDDWQELEVLDEFVYDGVLMYKISIGRSSIDSVPRLEIKQNHCHSLHDEDNECYRPTYNMVQEWAARLKWHKENFDAMI